MKRVLAVLGLIGSCLIGGGGAVEAVSITLNPSHQNRSHGQTAYWSMSWSGGAPYDTDFAYGDGAWWSPGLPTTTSANLNRTWWPCSSTTYNQVLYVTDGFGNFGSAGATTRVTGGTPC